MGKVRITQEQADLVEQFKRNFKGFGREILIEVIKGRYEIELKFKENDWVLDRYTARPLQLTYEGVSREDYVKLGSDRLVHVNDLRHATPAEIAEEKQRRFWHENGREVGEYKVNDVLSIGGSKYTWVITDVSGDIDGSTLYRFDNDIETTHKKAEFLDRFNVVCFAHDRKDIKND